MGSARQNHILAAQRLRKYAAWSGTEYTYRVSDCLAPGSFLAGHQARDLQLRSADGATPLCRRAQILVQDCWPRRGGNVSVESLGRPYLRQWTERSGSGV